MAAEEGLGAAAISKAAARGISVFMLYLREKPTWGLQPVKPELRVGCPALEPPTAGPLPKFYEGFCSPIPPAQQWSQAGASGSARQGISGCDNLSNLYRIERGALAELVAHEKKVDPVFAEHQALADPADLHRVLPGRRERHGIAIGQSFIDHDDALSLGQQAARFFGRAGAIRLHRDGFRVRPQSRNTHRGAAHGQLRQAEDLPAFPDHLHFFTREIG